MKIAAITDDGVTISQHFGRAQHYMVITVEDSKIVGREMRSKAGHHDFIHEGGHDHDEEHDPRGHGFGKGADRRHARMIASIIDCDVVLVRGMGRGAFLAMQNAEVEPIVTDIPTIDEAVAAYLDGTIINHIDRLH